MADPRKLKVVDGFTTIRAAQEAAKHGVLKQPEPAAAPPAPGAPGSPPADPAKYGSRLGRTVLPSRTEIVCPGCGHAFELTGKNQQTICPKCRVRLVIQDWAIEGEWDRDITTSGTVTVKESGVVKAGVILANNLVLHGRIEGGDIRVTRQTQLHPGCAWPAAGIPTRDLWLGEGVEYTASEPGLQVRNAEILGVFRGALECAGKCTIRATGCIEGRLKAAHLEVEDGGGLVGEMHIDPSLDPNLKKRPLSVPGGGTPPGT